MASDPTPRPPNFADRLAAHIQRFLAIESASTIVLVLATVAALVWANSPWGESYARFWHAKLGFAFAGIDARLSLEHWVNDGLMVIFFFLIGMELKHELVHGELSSRERAMLPVFGALGGMLVPAAIYAEPARGRPRALGLGRADGDGHRLRGGRAHGLRTAGAARASRSSCSRSRSSTISAP